MERFATHTDFQILDFIVGETGTTQRKDKNGKIIKFQKRACAEKYCKEHKCAYVERRYTFYR